MRSQIAVQRADFAIDIFGGIVAQLGKVNLLLVEGQDYQVGLEA